MYWKNEVLSPLSEGNKIVSEGVATKQVLARRGAARILLLGRKRFGSETHPHRAGASARSADRDRCVRLRDF